LVQFFESELSHRIKNIEIRKEQVQPTAVHNDNRTCKRGKAIPLQALTDPEGSRRLRLPDFKTIGT
jgi:hypothetical protein